MRANTFAASLLGALLVSAAQAPAQTAFPFEVEVGYRALDLSGSEDMYRSQINERNGVFLRTLSLTGVDLGAKSSFVDTLRLDAADLGASPHGTLRLETGKSGTWRLRINWRRSDAFSALPAFANPLLASGIVPGQHTSDRTRNMLDAEVEILPGRAITPFVGYTLNKYSGPGTTTYTIGGDDFKLTSDLEDKEQEVRVGANFAAGPVSGSVSQGWRQLQENETLTLAPGANNGNSSGTVLGVPVSATSLTRTAAYDVNTPVTNAFVVGRFGIFKVSGSYIRANGETDGPEREDVAGNFVSFAIRSFFKGFSSEDSARAKAEQWRAGGRAEANLVKGLDVFAGYTSRHRELEGLDLVTEVYSDTSNLAGVSTGTIEEVLEAHTAMERKEDVFDVGATWRDVGPFSFYATYRQTDQDVTVTPDPSEIVIPGGQGGSYERTVKSILGGARIALGAFSVAADAQYDDGDIAVVRTDFLERRRVRLRGEWRPSPAFHIGGTYLTIDTTNTDAGSGYDGETRQYSLDAEGSPWKWLTLHATTAQFKTDTSIPIRLPHNFAIDTSIYSENGRYLEGGVKLTLGKVLVEGLLAQLDSEGTSPFRIDRVRARLDVPVPVSAALGAGFEFANDRYKEGLSGLGNYNANRYGFYIRFAQ